MVIESRYECLKGLFAYDLEGFVGAAIQESYPFLKNLYYCFPGMKAQQAYELIGGHLKEKWLEGQALKGEEGEAKFKAVVCVAVNQHLKNDPFPSVIRKSCDVFYTLFPVPKDATVVDYNEQISEIEAFIRSGELKEAKGSLGALEKEILKEGCYKQLHKVDDLKKKMSVKRKKAGEAELGKLVDDRVESVKKAYEERNFEPLRQLLSDMDQIIYETKKARGRYCINDCELMLPGEFHKTVFVELLDNAINELDQEKVEQVVGCYKVMATQEFMGDAIAYRLSLKLINTDDMRFVKWALKKAPRLLAVPDSRAWESDYMRYPSFSLKLGEDSFDVDSAYLITAKPKIKQFLRSSFIEHHGEAALVQLEREYGYVQKVRID